MVKKRKSSKRKSSNSGNRNLVVGVIVVVVLLVLALNFTGYDSEEGLGTAGIFSDAEGLIEEYVGSGGGG